MQRKMVKILRSRNDINIHEPILELYMNDFDTVEGGAVTNYGETLLNKLKNKKFYLDGTEYSFRDGEKFLKILNKVFSTSYLTATEYKMQDSELNKLPAEE